MLKGLRVTLCTLSLLVMLPNLGQAQANDFPSKPIRVIVPFAAGGANDLIARALQRPLGKALGGTVVVENRAGGSTKIGTQALLRAEPDGHTLLLLGHVALMSYYYSGTYDSKVWDEMTVLGQTGQMAWGMLEARADAPFQTWQELIAFAKKNPGKLSAGGPALGGMMNLIILESAASAGIDITYIPYAGGAPSGAALLGGHVQYRVAQPPEVYPNVKAGLTRGLAVAFPTRLPEMPDVPTLTEAGYKLEVSQWFALFARAGTPKPIIDQLNAAAKIVLEKPDVREAIIKQGAEPEYATPQQLDTFFRAEIKRFGDIIRQLDIKVN